MSTADSQTSPEYEELKRKAARYDFMERAAFDDSVMELIASFPPPSNADEFRAAIDAAITQLFGVERQAA